MSIANLLKKNDYNIFSDKILQLNPNVVVRKSTTQKLLRNNETTIIKTSDFTSRNGKVKIEFSASVFGLVDNGNVLIIRLTRNGVSIGVCDFASDGISSNRVNKPLNFTFIDEGCPIDVEQTYQLDATNTSVGGQYNCYMSYLNRSLTELIISDV